MPTKRQKVDTSPIQLVDGAWYAMAFGAEPFTEECCSCGLVHKIKYKIENGRLWVQYRVDTKLTKQARGRRRAESKQ